MAKQTINVGAAAGDGTGDQLRTAFGKTNSMFTELYSLANSTGTSAQRPVGLSALQPVVYNDTTLGKPIIWGGAHWYDFTGTQVADYVAPTLASLTPATFSFTTGAAAGSLIGSFSNKTAGSTITFAPTNGADANKITINSSGQPVVGSVVMAAGSSVAGTLTETLASATNSPRTTPVTFSSVAAVVVPVKPSITGVPRVGEVLQGYVGSAGTGATQRWLANGTAIAGATALTYTLTSAEIGKTITIGVTPSGGAELVSQPTNAVLDIPDRLLLPNGTDYFALPSGTAFALPITGPTTVQLLAPFSASTSSFNQLSDPVNNFTYAVADADRFVLAAAGVPFCAYVYDACRLVEVWAAGAVIATFTPNGDHYAIGTIDLSAYKNGPRWFEVRCHNQPVAANASVTVYAGFWLCLTGGTNVDTSALPAGATGMTLQVQDEFTTLSISNSLTNDGSTWYTHTPYNGDFGDAAFTNRGSSRDPYTHSIPSYLCIRMQYDPTLVDGYNRVWYSGCLSAAFPDSTTTLGPTGNGYYEARALVPVGRGTWPAPLWMLNLDSIKHTSSPNGREIDVIEQYGTPGMTFYYATQHRYVGSNPDNATGFKINTPDLRWEFHKFGVKVTPTAIYYYFDDVLMATDTSRYNTGAANDAINYMLVNLANGAGYATMPPPPSTYHDMLVDYVRFYA